MPHRRTGRAIAIASALVLLASLGDCAYITEDNCAAERELRPTRLVRSALEQGINFIDTAEAYGTEENLVKPVDLDALEAALRPVPRDAR